MSFGEVSVEVALVLQPRGFVAFAEPTLDTSGFLLGSDLDSAIANDNVRSVLSFLDQKFSQIFVRHSVKAAEMSQQRRPVDADEVTFVTTKRRRNWQIGGQRIVEMF